MAPIRVLFLCGRNCGRSLMAASYLRSLGRGLFDSDCAGFSPAAAPRLVIEVMREAGLAPASRAVVDIRVLVREQRPYRHVVATCGPALLRDIPSFPGEASRLHWAFPDPATVTGTREEQLAAARSIRDDIRAQVIRFANDLT